MSEFIVSARKYRPKKFSDVVGQAHVSQTLKNALRTDHIAHAFLFCGPRGVGKTTNARILAKILNCTNRAADFEACDACDSCRAFAQSASFNIFELDAASNNSVEHVRSLVDQTRIPPQQGKYKVFIIDEVHMLSQAAFNAFLKTLEEPPAHAIFILATTEKHKIIPTILSRCQIFDFRRIQIPDIVFQLQSICQQEGITADADALHIIGQKADGAMRDALSIFDRIVSASTNKAIHYADVIENLNVLDYDYFFKITDALLSEDLPSVLNVFDEVMRRGFEGDTFITGLAEHLRNILVSKDIQTIALLEVGENLKARYQNQAALSSTSFVLTALNLCNDCDVNYKMARQKRLHVEMSLIKMTYIGRAVDLAAAPQGLVEKKTNVVSKLENKSAKTGNQAPPPYKQPENVSFAGEDDLPSYNPSTETPGPAVSTAKSMVHSSMIPSMKIGSLEAISAQIEEEERLLKQAVSKLNQKNLADTWQKYAETRDSPSTKAALQSTKLSFKAKKITASVGSTLMVGIIQQEFRLPEFLRFDLNDAGITLEVVYDEALAPQETKSAPMKRYLSPRDKLMLMMEVNPLVKDFAIRLNLKPDE
jgi:DNA polymerase III subunit gamma/tau